MPDTNTNRKIVQEGLDARAAQRAEAAEDAAHEAAERSMLAVVNRNAEARRNKNYITKSELDDQWIDAELLSRHLANFNLFMERTFGSLVIPSIMVYHTVHGLIPIGLTIAAWIAAGLFIIANSVAYALRNRSAREALAKAWKRIVKKNNTIN